MRTGDPITELRRAIDQLPVRTREAMLEGIRSNPIVVGAYTDNRGGICPMLAAHRHGGRTTLLAFARSWDRFARARTVRRASRRELTILESELTASLLAAEAVDLKAAIAEHEALKRRHDSGRTFPEIKARRLRRAFESAVALADAVDEPQQVQRREGLGQEEVGARLAGAPLG